MIPSQRRAYVRVDPSEVTHAIEIASERHREGISFEVLSICADMVGRRVFEGLPFPQSVSHVLRTELRGSLARRRLVYDDAIRIIFARRHEYAVQHAEAHGYEPPKSPFRRVPQRATKGSPSSFTRMYA